MIHFQAASSQPSQPNQKTSFSFKITIFLDLDFLAPDISPHHLANEEKMKELRQLFLSGGVSFGEIFAQLSGDSISGLSKKSTTEKPHTSTARLPIKHHFHWEDPPTDLVMKNKERILNIGDLNFSGPEMIFIYTVF